MTELTNFRINDNLFSDSMGPKKDVKKHDFIIESSLVEIAKLGVIYFSDLQVKKYDYSLAEEIAGHCSFLKASYHSTDGLHQLFSGARKLFRSLKLDPTKNRPSSEALMRRILHGKELYQINSIVDICNLCSIHFFLSIGLYDVKKIVGDTIWLRLGKAGEGYVGIGKENVNVSGKLTVVDKVGPFGNPSADSDRTKITLQTTDVLFIVFAPKEYEDEQLNRHLDFINSKVKSYHDCTTGFKFIV